MKTKRILTSVIIIVVVLLVLTTGLTWAMNSQIVRRNTQAVAADMGITYQGYLEDNSSPADGTFDFIFSLYDDDISGTFVVSTTVDDVLVEDGLFTANLDFDSGDFDGEERWMEIQVRPDGTGS